MVFGSVSYTPFKLVQFSAFCFSIWYALSCMAVRIKRKLFLTHLFAVCDVYRLYIIEKFVAYEQSLERLWSYVTDCQKYIFSSKFSS